MLTAAPLPQASPDESWTTSTLPAGERVVTSSTTFAPHISTDTNVYPPFQEGTPLIEYIHQHQQPTIATVTRMPVTTETLERGDVERVAHVVDGEFDRLL